MVGGGASIPHKDNEHAKRDPKVQFDPETYRQRCVIEQSIDWFKENRQIGTRFEKLTVHLH